MKYTVNKLSKLLDVSVNTIRRYTKMGYVDPDVDDSNGYTYYSNRDIKEIIRVRMYRKFGFSHDDIKNLFESSPEEIQAAYDKRIKDIENEIESLTKLKRKIKADGTMIRRIEEFEKFYITQIMEEGYCIEYQKGDEIFFDKDRMDTIHTMLYDLSETKEVMIFDRFEFDKGVFAPSFGFYAKFSDMEKHNIEPNELMTHIPSKRSIYFSVKLFSDSHTYSRQNENILNEHFTRLKSYLDIAGLKAAGNIIGFDITESKEEGEAFTYTLIGVPIEPIL